MRLFVASSCYIYFFAEYLTAERRVRGILYFELHAALMEMGRRRSSIYSADEVHLSLMVYIQH